MIHALLLSALGRPAARPLDPQTGWHDGAAGRRLAQAITKRWSSRRPASSTFFRQATPFPELGTLNLASRPVSRAGRGRGRDLALDDLRAIPWVFSWTQVRVNLPGWFGLGTALAAE